MINNTGQEDTITPTPATPARRSAFQVIARNTVFVMLAQIALRGLAFLFNIFVVNRLGDTGFGQYSIVLAWTGIFAFIGDMGIAQYMTREIARDREKSVTMFWDVAALRLILAVIAIAVTVVGAVMRGYSGELVVAIAVLSSSYFIQAFLTPLQATIAGHERLDVLSVLTVFGQVIFYVVAAIFLVLKPGFLWLVIASMVNLPVLTAICTWIVVREKMHPPRFKLTPANWLPLLKFGLPFALIQVSLTFAFRFDTLILEANYSDDVVGWYNAAYTLTRSLLILSSAFTVALVPTMAREYVTDPDIIRPWYFRTIKFITLIGLPLAMGGMVLADKIILRLYQPDFAPAVLAFAILIWDTPLLMYTSICGNFTTAMKQEKKAAWVYGSEGIFNIAMNLLLIPRYGILAASVVTVATELVGTIMFYLIFRRELGPGLGLYSMLRITLASVLMGAGIFFLRQWNVFLLVALGVMVYFLLIWALRALNPEDVAILTRVSSKLKSRLPAFLRR
ncbi:MAG TPA: flippase [Anaerolineaceae bacterium]